MTLMWRMDRTDANLSGVAPEVTDNEDDLVGGSKLDFSLAGPFPTKLRRLWRRQRRLWRRCQRQRRQQTILPRRHCSIWHAPSPQQQEEGLQQHQQQ
jgi:hypothetical protein